MLWYPVRLNETGETSSSQCGESSCGKTIQQARRACSPMSEYTSAFFLHLPSSALILLFMPPNPSCYRIYLDNILTTISLVVWWRFLSLLCLFVLLGSAWELHSTEKSWCVWMTRTPPQHVPWWRSVVLSTDWTQVTERTDSTRMSNLTQHQLSGRLKVANMPFTMHVVAISILLSVLHQQMKYFTQLS